MAEEKDLDEEPEEKPTPEQTLRQAKYLALIVLMMIVVAIGAFLMVQYWKVQESQKPDDSYKYNYFDFEKKDGIWYTQSQDGNNLYLIAMRYGPKELENITVIGNVPELRKKWGFFYITFDPTEEQFGEVTMANAEISTKLVQHFSIGLGAACTKPTEECILMNATIVGCENSTLPVIFLNQEPGPLVEVRGNCAIIQGEGEDIIKAADRFMYNMYGIMK